MPQWLINQRKPEVAVDMKAKRGDNGDAPKVVTEMCEYLTLFRRQHIDVGGDIYCKVSKFLRSRKHYAELRGCTLVIFRNVTAARDPKPETDSVLAVLLLGTLHVEVLQMSDSVARIFIHTPSRDTFHSLYLKLAAGSTELQRWRVCLARARVIDLPTLHTLTVESVIGQGGGGKVFMVRWGDEYYALKVINKRKTFRSARSIRHVASERFLMEQAGTHPYLLRMEFAFQTRNNLFIGTPLCAGGDLSAHVRRNGLKMTAALSRQFAPDCVSNPEKGRCKKYYGRLPEAVVQVAVAEILLGLRHLHKRGIVYRDLKPENVLIDADGHLKIGDFGLAKHLHLNHNGSGYLRTNSICGTRNYLPPEMLRGKTYSMEADMWSLGIMVYRLICGCFPFDAPRTKEVFKQVRYEAVQIPDVLSLEARSLIENLLAKDPATRLSVEQCMDHPFFADIDFARMLQKRFPPPINKVKLGIAPTDVLDNFELSKLQGITIGEVVNKADTLNQTMADEPLPTANPKGRLIGFEYVVPNYNSLPPEPIEIARKNGLLARIVSIDSDGLLSPLRSMSS